MRALWWMTTLLVAGCIEEMEPGSPFEPVVIPPCECPVCPEVEEEAPAEEETADAQAEEETPEESTEDDAVEEVVSGDPFQQAFEEKEEAAVPEETAVPDTNGWPEGLPAAAGWGVRLVSVVPGAVPPQAVLGFSDGSNQVVKAGDLIPSAGLVIVAIGVERVQVVQVTPAGDHATIESKELSSMYPARP